MEGTPQFGGQNYSSTHATQNWGIKDVPTPRALVAQLDQWVIGQKAAKKVCAFCASHVLIKGAGTAVLVLQLDQWVIIQTPLIV